MITSTNKKLDKATFFQSRVGKRLLLAAGLLACIALIIGGILQYVKVNTLDYVEVYVDGSPIGTAASQDDIDQMLGQLMKNAQAAHPNLQMKIDSSGISYVHASGYKAQPQTDATLTKLSTLLVPYAVGTQIIVDGKVIGTVKNTATAEAILQQIRNTYAPPARMKTAEAAAPKAKSMAFKTPAAAKSPQSQDGVSKIGEVSFKEKIETKEVRIDPTQLMGQNQLYDKMTTGNTKKVTYTVQQGDCVGCIAAKFGISREVIYTNNPSIKDDMIRVGDVLDLTVQSPAVTVETIESMSETITTKPQVIVQKRDTMMAGEKKVIQAGQPGSKRLTYKLVKQNGKLMSQELVGVEVLEQSVPEIVWSGTKVISGKGSGKFAWPVKEPTITSRLGMRWNRMHKGLDMVGGSSIMASDAGRVSFAGERSGYGNLIIIDHQNGYETWYGHLSKIEVKSRQTVEKGQKIGVMGNTGHSTGTHLHFELHKNGEIQNPLEYL